MGENFMPVFLFLFMTVFILIFGSILVSIIRNLVQWNKNNNSPQLIVNALVVTKTSDTHHHFHNTHHHSSTYFYATFEVESSDRIELSLRREDYGMLAEGDQGKLTFQGTRFISFERI